MQAAPAGPLPLSADAPFARLWLGFLTGRVMVALALLVLQGVGQLINQSAAPSVLAVCVAYLVATVVLRVLSLVVIMTNQIHKWAHMPEVPAAVRRTPARAFVERYVGGLAGRKGAGGAKKKESILGLLRAFGGEQGGSEGSTWLAPTLSVPSSTGTP